MSISIITPNDVVVDKGSVNTLVGDMVRVDIPTLEEERALLTFDEDFRQPELASHVRVARAKQDARNALDHAINSALSQGFTIDESSDGQERWAHLSA